MPELSIILATINDSIACNLTCANIISQLEQDNINYEIILIDNNSLPEEKDILNQFLRYHINFPIKYFDFSITGTIPIHSFGVEKASGQYIAMPEPHIILSPHYYKIMLDTLKKLKKDNVEVVFSPFNTGTIVKHGGNYLAESVFMKPNPFGKAGAGGMGSDCKKGDPKRAIFTGSFAGMVCEREWMLKIGNLFPGAFFDAGGYVAESILIGILTWMFGKKCFIEPKVTLEHPVYRITKGPGRNESMYASMAVAAYIAGGEKYLEDAAQAHVHGPFTEEYLADIRLKADYAREYVEQNTKYSLDYLVDNWETIKNG